MIDVDVGPERKWIDDLESILDDKSVWMVRGDFAAAPVKSLRTALQQAYQIFKNGGTPLAIVQLPNDAVRVEADQIFLLWKRLGLQLS